ncbi:MAG TPA: hypothetical protein VIA61_14160 [Methylomirabilota bacterium]|jgi:hypothetical protein
MLRSRAGSRVGSQGAGTRPGGSYMYNIFYIIGVIVVVLAILGYFGFR